MHELSIAMSIVEISEEESANLGARIAAVHLKLGALSGVVKETLLFNFEIACQGTPLEGARLEIEDVPVTALCPKCRAPRRVESIQWLVCPECKTPVSVVIEGRELQVIALELVEQNDPATAFTGS
jgi:hydrogenase nickel incorporation protein HypA/HybF